MSENLLSRLRAIGGAIGALASLIAVIAFMTGKQSLPDLANLSPVPPSSMTPISPPNDLSASLQRVLDLTYTSTIPATIQPNGYMALRLQSSSRHSPPSSIIASGSTLSTGDTYNVQLHLTASAYCYVFQVDAKGRLYWLYPKNESPFSTGTNPTPSGTSVLPSQAQAYVLDEFLGLEHVYFIATAQQWTALEDLLRSAQQDTTTPRPLSKPLERKTRGIAGIAGAQPGETISPVPSSDSVVDMITGVNGILAQEVWFQHRQ